MGKWMSFFLFILSSGKSGVLVFFRVFSENVGWILSNFFNFWICNWPILSLFGFLWIIYFRPDTFVSSCSVSDKVWTQSESGCFFFFLDACRYLIFYIYQWKTMSFGSLPSKAEVLNWDSHNLADFLKKVGCFLFLCRSILILRYCCVINVLFYRCSVQVFCQRRLAYIDLFSTYRHAFIDI